MTALTGINTEMETLLRRFKLPTVAAELTHRVSTAGHEAALPELLEVLRAERDDRMERRVQRLLKAARLPPGKTLEALDEAVIPPNIGATIRSTCSPRPV